MKLQMGPLSDVAFLSSIWHICFLSQGPSPSCSLDKGVLAELLKSYNAAIVDPSLVQKAKHKKKKSVKEPKRPWNMDPDQSFVLVLHQSCHRLITIFQERCKRNCFPVRYSALSSFQLQTYIYKLLTDCLENLT